VDGKFTTQLERVTGLAACRPCAFEDGDRTLFRQSRVCRSRAWATCDRAQGGKDVPSCIAGHLHLSGRTMSLSGASVIHQMSSAEQ
jgi:hypothetical protein